MTTKRFLSFFMALALVFSFMVFPAYAAEEATLGDLNGDSAVNTDDVIALLLYLTMPDRYPLEGHLDFTGESTVNTDDAVQLLLHVSMPDRYPLAPAPTEPTEPSEPAVESLVLGNNAVTLEAGDEDGAAWSYTADFTGNLKIDVAALAYDWEGNGEFYQVPEVDLGFAFGRTYCMMVDGVEYHETSATVAVTEGQVLEIKLVSYYGYATQADLVLSEAKEDVGGEPIVSTQDVSIAAGDVDGETFTYTAQKDGALTVAVTSLKYDWIGEGEFTEVSGMDLEMGFGRMYCLTIDGVQYYQASATVNVAAGQTVVVTLVSAYGYATNATVTFTEVEAGSEPTEPTVPGEPDGTQDNPFVIEELPYSIPFFGGMDQYYVYTSAAAGNVVVSYLEGGILSLPNGEAWDTDAEGNYVIPVEAGYELVLNPWTMQPEISGEMVVTFSEEEAPELPMTPAEIVYAAYSLAAGESLEGTYTLTGVVTNINTPYDETNENISVSIVVEDMVEFPILCYRLSGEGADKIGKGDTVTVTGSLTNYKGTIEFAQGCTLDAWEDTGAEEILPETPVEIVYAAYSLAVGETLTGRYTLTGEIISIDTPYDEGYKNVSVTIVVEDMENFPIFCFRLKGEGADQIAVGDIITATGVLKNYYGTIEFDAGCTLDAWERPSVEPTEPSTEPTEPSTEPTAPSIPTVEFLVEGDNVVGLNGNDLDGETWTYTAQKNGTLTIEVTALKYDWMGAGEFTEASAMDLQMGFGRMYCLTVDAVQNYSYQVTVNVTAGQIVDVNLMSAYGYPTIATLTLTEAEGGAEVPTEPTVPGEPDGTQNNPFVIDALPYTINFFGGMDQYYTYTTTEAGNIVVTALEGGLLSLPNGEYWEQDEAGNYVIPVEAGYELVLNPWTMRPELEGAMVVSFVVPGAEPTEPSEEPTEPSEEPAPAPATYVFSDYKVDGELGGGAVIRALDDVVTANLSTGWFTGELRVYKNANVVFSSTVAMDSIVVNAGYKDSTFDVYVSEDGETWTLYQADVAYTSAYSDITIDLPDGCKNVQLVADMAQLRLKTMTVTFAGGSAPVEPTEPSVEPTEPSVEPTEPSVEPTEPSEEPTEPSEEPTEPSVEPTEPTTEPTEPSAPAVDYITEPVVDKAFKFRLVQKTAGKTLYLTGEMSGYYYATTENVEEAVDVYLEEVEGGYRVYFLKDGVKTYMEMAKSGTHNNVVFVTAPTKVLKWNAEIASVTCDLDGTDFYFGTYGTYKTFSASKISFVTGTGAATFDETNFVGHFVEVAEAPVEPTEPSVEPTEPSVEPTAPSEEPTEPSAEPTEPTAPAVAYVTEPVVGQAYKFMLTQKNLGKELYITGAMDGYYYATTEDAAAAVTVYFEEAEGGYYVYFVKEGIKNYMEIVASGTYKNVKFVTTPTKVLKWNAEIASVTCDVNGVDHYFGTYNTFKTFSASDVSRVTGDGAATMDVTNFVGHFYVAEGEAPVEPTEPSVEPTEPSVEPTEPSVEPTEPSAPAAAAYNKITSIDQLVSGQYVLVVNSGYAPGVVDGTWITAAQPVVEGNQVTDTQGAVWTLNVTEQGVSLKDANGVFVAPKGGNNNGIKTGTEYFWAIEVQEDGTFRLVGTGSDTVILASNADAQYGNKFRGYKTTTVSGNAKTYPSFFTLYLFGEAEAPVEPTEPSVEPTEPSVEPTEPSVEPTEPSEEPTEPSAPAVDYITEPVVDKAFKFRLVQKTAGKTLYLTGEMSGYYYATTENVEEAVDVYLEEVEGGYRVYFLKDGVKTYLEMAKSGTHNNVVFVTAPTKVLKWNAEIASVTCDLDGTDFYFGTYGTYKTFSASKISYVTGTGAASFDETNFVGHFVEVAAEEEESKLLTWQEYVAMTGVEQRAYKESFENSADYYAWLEGAQAAYDAEHESVMDGVINLGDLVNKG